MVCVTVLLLLLLSYQFFLAPNTKHRDKSKDLVLDCWEKAPFHWRYGWQRELCRQRHLA